MKEETHPLVSVVTVNFRQPAITCDMLDSLTRSTYPKLEVILVDNGMEEDLQERFAGHYPELLLLKSWENLGFAGGTNLGIRRASGKYILLLNNDTVVPPGFLEPMVDLLEDPFTGFYQPEAVGDPEAFDPTYGGIGALLDGSAAGEDTEGLRILYVFEGSSAADAGIRARDRVIAVEGDSCARIAEIRGPAGTEVTLTVVSPGEEPRDITLERRQIDPVIRPQVRRLEADPAVGYLGVLALSGQDTINAIEQGLTELLRDGPLEGLILDLRASNQGAPAVTIEALSHFVRGQVGEYHSRLGNEPIEIEPSSLADDYASVPLAVLVDEETEADAEQLAAILQDQGRAIVVGTPTSGKTHGATTIDFPEGSLLQIVTFGFQLPDGRTLEGEGVTPDVLVEADWLAYPEADDPFVAAALEALSDAGPAAEAEPSAG